MHKVYLSLGSNMGDKMAHLNKAIDLLSHHEAISNLKVSSFYETAPVGYLDQDTFVNIAIELSTSLEPLAMLEVCQSVEQALHRKRIIRWGPRTIDVDIILFDDIISDDEVLTLPHPRAHERGFVLVPLLELNDALKIKNKTLSSWIESLDVTEIRKIKWTKKY